VTDCVAFWIWFARLFGNVTSPNLNFRHYFRRRSSPAKFRNHFRMISVEIHTVDVKYDRENYILYPQNGLPGDVRQAEGRQKHRVK